MPLGVAGVVVMDTFVDMARCTSCSFDWEMQADALVPYSAGRVPGYRAAISPLASDPGSVRRLRTRPRDDVWAPVEYLAHMRDVAAFYAERIDRILSQDRPVLHVSTRFAELPDLRRYRDEDPMRVLVQFEEQAEQLLDTLRDLDPARWSRAGIGSEGDERTTLVLARRFAHEVHHHLADIEAQIAGRRAARGRDQ